jgi:hypothetical protein
MVIGDITGEGRQVIVIGTRRASLHAIDPRREGYLWSHNLGHEVRGCDLIIGADGKPLVVAGSLSGFVTAFNGAGARQWATPVGGPVAFRKVAGLGGRQSIIAALQSGGVVALSRTGKVTRRVLLPSRPAALAIAGEGADLLLVAGEDGVIRALSTTSP